MQQVLVLSAVVTENRFMLFTRWGLIITVKKCPAPGSQTRAHRLSLLATPNSSHYWLPLITFFDWCCWNLQGVIPRVKTEFHLKKKISRALLRIYSHNLIFQIQYFLINSFLRVIFWLKIPTSSFGSLSSFSVGLFAKSLTVSKIWFLKH